MGDSLSGAGPIRNATAQDSSLVAVVLAAGEGRRLSPLTSLRPKALCPVGGVALLDLAVARVGQVTPAVAVNLHHGLDQMMAHLDRGPAPIGPISPAGHGLTVHRSVEQPEALGTAGALGALRDWIAGRGVLVHNADAWCQPDLADFVAGWDGERVRVLVTGPPGPAGFGPRVGLVATLLPWSDVVGLAAVASGLYEAVLAPAWAGGRLEAVGHAGPFVDCGTPADYLAANLAAVDAAGGASLVAVGAETGGQVRRSVVGAGARVDGRIERCVLWEGAVVGPDEDLRDVVRAPGLRRDVACG
jgi:N-acetyl-alpha-D-muramate 1-phosphate uridylyltransferase